MARDLLSILIQIGLKLVRNKEFLLVLFPILGRLERGRIRHIHSLTCHESLVGHLLGHHLLKRYIKVLLIEENGGLLLN